MWLAGGLGQGCFEWFCWWKDGKHNLVSFSSISVVFQDFFKDFWGFPRFFQGFLGFSKVFSRISGVFQGIFKDFQGFFLGFANFG